MIKLKIDVTKIKKEHIFEGKKGKYLSLTLLDNKDGRDQYGNDGFVVQQLSKEAFDSGERGAILGNWSKVEPKEDKPQAPVQYDNADDDSDIPF